MSAVVETIENPFGTAPVVARPGENVAVASAQAREVAEVQASMVIAKRFPRDKFQVMDQILQDFTRPGLAEAALYEFGRGGSDVRGLSIRAAECLAQNWGHIAFGWRVLEERPGSTKVQTYAWDMQTGTRADRDFTVAHEVQTKQGKKTLLDPRDIYEHIASLASRRLRACILAVIPGDVQEAAQRQCEQTLRLKVEVTPEKLQSLVDKFADYGVTKAQIERRIQRRLEAITPGLMVSLGKIYTSLKDGMSGPGEWFHVEHTSEAPQEGPGGPGEAGVTQTPAQKVRTRLEAARKARAGGQVQTPAPAPSDTLADLVAFCRSATSEDDLVKVRDIAMQLTDEREVKAAQAYIDAAAARIRGPV